MVVGQRKCCHLNLLTKHWLTDWVSELVSEQVSEWVSEWVNENVSQYIDWRIAESGVTKHLNFCQGTVYENSLILTVAIYTKTTYLFSSN